MLRDEKYEEKEEKNNNNYEKEIDLYEECIGQVEEHIKDLHHL